MDPADPVDPVILTQPVVVVVVEEEEEEEDNYRDQSMLKEQTESKLCSLCSKTGSSK